MRVVNLGSGSKGNSTFIEAGGLKILVDAGLSSKELESRLSLVGHHLDEIDAVLITHEHSDHICGLLGVLKKSKAHVYMHKTALSYFSSNAYIDRISLIEPYAFWLGEIRVIPFALPHDSKFCLGYIFEYKEKKIAFVTDLGYMPDNVLDLLIGCQLIYIESNHDRNMLACCYYPKIVKDRIASNQGHLSNEQASKVIVFLAKKGTKHFVLSHISENSNTIEKAYLTSAKALENAGFSLENDVFLRYSRQDRPGNNYYFGE